MNELLRVVVKLWWCVVRGDVSWDKVGDMVSPDGEKAVGIEGV